MVRTLLGDCLQVQVRTERLIVQLCCQPQRPDGGECGQLGGDMDTGCWPGIKALCAAANLEDKGEGKMFRISMNMVFLCSNFLKVCPDFWDKHNRTVAESYFSFYYCFNYQCHYDHYYSMPTSDEGILVRWIHSFGFQTSHVMLLHYWDLLFMPDNIFWLFYHSWHFILHPCILSLSFLSLSPEGNVWNFSKQKQKKGNKKK